MGPQNGIMGEDSPTELPDRQIDESQLAAMAKTARFSKTAEYKELKEHLEGRIDFYQKYLPDGRAIGAQDDMDKMAKMWVVANVLIGEFKAVIDAYEGAAQYVKDATSNTKRT